VTGFGIVEVRRLGKIETNARGAVAGLGASAKVGYIGSGCVRVPQGELGDRLRAIYDGISETLTTYRPDFVSIEKIFMARNADSALKLGQARAAALLAAAHRKIPIFEYTALQIKRAVVGYGHAQKDQVVHMVKALLQLPGAPQADAADALAAAICHAHNVNGRGPLERRRRPRLRLVRERS
jgi:crossover junction endodeoxyribonuclease RuvC